MKINLKFIINSFFQKTDDFYQKQQGKKIIHFLHIGKTGGTAIRYTLQSYHHTNRVKLKFPYHEFKLNQIPKGEKAVIFLRHPVDRFLSSFHSRKRMGKPKYNSLWSSEERIAFTNFTTANELALALTSDDSPTKEKAEYAMKNIYHVRHSFFYWLGSYDYFTNRIEDIFFLGFQENLNEDFCLLKQKLHLPMHLKLPKDAINAHINPIKEELSQKSIENIENWYADDIEFYELCKNDLAQRINVTLFPKNALP